MPNQGTIFIAIVAVWLGMAALKWLYKISKGNTGPSGQPRPGGATPDRLAAQRREELRRLAAQQRVPPAPMTPGSPSGGELTARDRARQLAQQRAEALRQLQGALPTPPSTPSIPPAPPLGGVPGVPGRPGVLSPADLARRRAQEIARLMGRTTTPAAGRPGGPGGPGVTAYRPPGTVARPAPAARPPVMNRPVARPPAPPRRSMPPARPAPRPAARPTPPCPAAKAPAPPRQAARPTPGAIGSEAPFQHETHAAARTLHEQARTGAVAPQIRYNPQATVGARAGRASILLKGESLRQAIILREVLNRPVALRQPEQTL